MTTITIDRAVVEQALEALEAGLDVNPILAGEAEEALRAALAQQAEPVQEPVAWMRPDNRVAEESYSRTQFSRGRDKPPIGTWTPLYPAPPQRQPLTEEEIDKIFKHLCNTVGASCKTMARAVERAHGIKE